MGRTPWGCVCGAANYTDPDKHPCGGCGKDFWQTRRQVEDQPDAVNHPPHYNYGGAECIDVLADLLGPQGLQDYCVGNAFKYLWRHKHKGKAVQDLKKARFYLDFLLSKLDEQEDPRDSK